MTFYSGVRGFVNISFGLIINGNLSGKLYFPSYATRAKTYGIYSSTVRS